ncbi:MAG: hypothetical protein ABI378_15010 [Chitinophagaceae bacterium]
MMRPFLVIACFGLALVSVFSSCKKNKDDTKFSAKDSLLGSWSRELRAYDYNQNHVLDSSEIKIAPATDTFLLSLGNDATYQRTQTFKGVDFKEFGTWHLQNDNHDIVFQPTTSTSIVDTFRFDTVSQYYFRFHRISGEDVWYWEDYRRP